MEIREIVRKHALKNAHDYGKADFKSIVGKVIAEHPEAKGDVSGLMAAAREICDSVNSMGKADVESELSKYEFEEKGEKEREWKVEHAEPGKVVARFSPEPNGHLHIGHSKALMINRKVADEYNGKFIIKFDDTNPSTCREEYVDSILNDCEWLGIKSDGVYFVSKMMGKIYGHAEALIGKGVLYVCTCSSDEIKRGREMGEECVCRSRGTDENMGLWNSMLTDMPEGSAVVRIKGDMKSENTVMRDPAMLRIIDGEHYRLGRKYRVWPTYDFENPLSDAMLGVTHALRSKEFELRAELHRKIVREAGFPEIIYYEFARVAIDGYPVSKRLIRPHVESGLFMGYDDPRLVTLAGLRRRGIPPEAVREFALSFGLSKQDTSTDLKKLIASARKHYDPIARRMYAAQNPVMMHVEGLGSGEVEIRNHPTGSMGTRKVHYSENLLISRDDFAALSAGMGARLKELGNVDVIKASAGVVECALSKSQEVGRELRKIQWVDAEDFIEGEMWELQPPFTGDAPNEDSLRKTVLAVEKSAESIEVGEVVQLERMGFFRLDSKKPKMVFIRTD